MKRRKIRRFSAISTALLACMLAFGCGGGGGDGGMLGPGVSYFATFDGDTSGNVGMDSSGTPSGAEFDIEVVVNDIDKLFGAAFHVTFDSGVADFVTPLGTDSILGADADFQAALVGLGELAVSASMTGTQAGIDNATGRLIVLRFRATAETTGSSFSFEPVSSRRVKICPTANAPCSNTLLPDWTGGSLTSTVN